MDRASKGEAPYSGRLVELIHLKVGTLLLCERRLVCAATLLALLPAMCVWLWLHTYQFVAKLPC